MGLEGWHGRRYVSSIEKVVGADKKCYASLSVVRLGR
jgi:hypothetical protein